jgi:hypothetical protein
MASRQGGPIAGLILGSLMLVGGYFLADRIGKPMRAQAAASVAWPTTEGQITVSRVERTNRAGKGKANYTAVITYQYSLDGKTFEGDRVWFGDGYLASHELASAFRAAVHRYPVGKAVNVHYDPAEPAESVLEPGPTWSGSALYFVGLGLMTLGGIILVSALGTLLFMTAALAAVIGGLVGGRRDRTRGFGPRLDEPTSDFNRPAPRPLGRSDPEQADDDGIEII